MPTDNPCLTAALNALQALRSPNGLSFRADGRALAFTLSPATSEQGRSRASRVWQSDLRGGVEQLTFGPGSDVMIGFAPDDGRLLFLSDRDMPGKMGLMIRSEDGKEAALADLPGSVEQASWAPDGRHVHAVSVDRGLHTPATDRAVPLVWGEAEDPKVVSPASQRRRLFRIDAETGDARDIDVAGLNVWQYAAGATGLIAAIGSKAAAERGWHHAELVVVSPETGTIIARYKPTWQIQCPVFALDETAVYVLEGWASDRGLVAGGIRRLDLESGQAAKLAADELDDITSIGLQRDGSLWFAGWQGFGTRYGVVAASGAILWSAFEDGLLGPDRFVAEITAAPDGRGLAAIRETTGRPGEVVFRSDRSMPWTEVTAFNTGLADAAGKPAITDVAWKARDGTTIHGLWVRPKGTVERPGPMIVVVHGGPTTSVKHMFDPCSALAMAAAGYSLLIPNYRGSVGRGQAFAQANVGDPGGVDVEDILAGVDWALAEGLAEPGRIGITGVSYGGYLTAWAITQTDRFAAAVVVAGIGNLASCHATCNHAFCTWIAGGGGSADEPTTAALMTQRSPITHLQKARAPTLLLSGLLDGCTPPGQAEELYNGLAHHGVETELVLYPREGHNFTEAAHQSDARRRAMIWFDRHLKGAAGR